MYAEAYALGEIKCHKCKTGTLRRSRSRTWWEKWRKATTGKRLYRCDVCDWRGWSVDTAQDEPPPQKHPTPTNALPGRDERSAALNLRDLDSPHVPPVESDHH